jgi:hypothetical protein
MWIEPLPTRFDEFQWTVYQLGTGGTPWPRDVADMKNQYRNPPNTQSVPPPWQRERPVGPRPLVIRPAAEPQDCPIATR